MSTKSKLGQDVLFHCSQGGSQRNVFTRTKGTLQTRVGASPIFLFSVLRVCENPRALLVLVKSLDFRI